MLNRPLQPPRPYKLVLHFMRMETVLDLTRDPAERYTTVRIYGAGMGIMRSMEHTYQFFYTEYRLPWRA